MPLADRLAPAVPVLLGLLLLPAAWLDLRRRAIPFVIGPVLLVLAVLYAAVRLPAGPVDTALAVGGAAALLAALAGLVRWIAPADTLICLAVILAATSAEPALRPAALGFGGAGVGAALTAWYARRAWRSFRISGWPRNGWDLLALTKGRAEHEPELERLPLPRRDDDWLLCHLEAFRTPDGDRLIGDPCPLCACLLIGHAAMLAATWSLA